MEMNAVPAGDTLNLPHVLLSICMSPPQHIFHYISFCFHGQLSFIDPIKPCLSSEVYRKSTCSIVPSLSGRHRFLRVLVIIFEECSQSFFEHPLDPYTRQLIYTPSKAHPIHIYCASSTFLKVFFSLKFQNSAFDLRLCSSLHFAFVSAVDLRLYFKGKGFPDQDQGLTQH